jgi:predicted phage tail protein
MNTTALKSKTGREIDQQIKNARAVLRELNETLEDLEDLRAFEKAKEKNAGKPGTPWEIVAKELGIRPPAKKRKRKS